MLESRERIRNIAVGRLLGEYETVVDLRGEILTTAILKCGAPLGLLGSFGHRDT